MYVIPFTQISTDQQALVGTKGLSLGEMTQAKFMVPEGYVITAQAFADFLLKTDIHVAIKAELDKVNLEDLHSVDYASRILMDLIASAEIPEEIAEPILQQFNHINSQFAAVRSSAFSEENHSITWTGELATHLNVGLINLLERVKDCWASLFTTRSLYYIHQKHLPVDQIRMAVLVQRMIDARVAGLTYTAHLVTRDKNQMVIEAGLGLGESVVERKVTPDTYVIQKKPAAIIDRNISDQKIIITSKQGNGTETKELDSPAKSSQKLTDEEIKELVTICTRLEKYYKKPITIEWALADKFYILQARPITMT